ncbi:MAG: 2-hydroxyacyl-CoA dehydratase [Desulfobacteraceae bacterium]|nr:2-hydroxyacyl-CoA dehydratase [Desulfobacteraceae bacterium]
MMKSSFQDIVAFMEPRLEKKPRGFDLFTKELAASMVRAYEENVKTVYVSGYAFPTELLWAFDVIPFDFEIACNNLPAASGGNGSTIMTTSEKEGYSRDICSFDRLIIACMIQGMLPKGDVYISSSYYCHGKAKANEIVANHEGKESILFDVPNEISDSSLEYVTAQLKDIASRLEAATGEKLDMDRLKKALRWSNKARSSLERVNELMKWKPFPYNPIKACLLALGGAIFWGSPIREEIHQLVIKELEDRIDQGTALPEKHRILWSPWVPVQQTNIFTTLKELQVSVPMVETARVWWSELDESKSFESLARKALENYLVGRGEKRVRALVTLAEEYDVDGVIHFSTPACHCENVTFPLVRDAMKEKNLPALNLEGDMTDERNFSPEQTKNKLTSFVEVLKGRTRNPGL